MDDARDELGFLFKLLIIGDAATGKTALMVRYSENLFNDRTRFLFEKEQRVKKLVVDGLLCKVFVWNATRILESPVLITRILNLAHAVIINYDITNRESF